MLCRGFVWPLVSVALFCSLIIACGPGEDAKASAERDAEWAYLQETHSQLREQRDQLRELRARIAAGPEALEPVEGDEGTEDGSEAVMSPEEALLQLEEEASALEEEITETADEFVPRLVGFINADPMVQGEEPTEQQLASLRMKSDEDIELALEYVDKGGDYKRAIEILERAQVIDPENERLTEVIAELEDMRYIDEERFALVENGMGQPEVEAILGRVFHRNVREYEDQGALAWFYPKDPEIEGGAAAVFFKEDRAGEWIVYQMDFSAVKRNE